MDFPDLSEPSPNSLSPESIILLTQHARLREETVKRIEVEHQLSQLAILAAGTIVAAGLQNRNAALILLYPILATFLAAAWTHNNRRIRQMGAFVRARIEAKIGPEYLGWETFRASPEGKFGSLNFVATRGIFLGTEVLAILVGGSVSNLGEALAALYRGSAVPVIDPLVLVLLAIGILCVILTIIFMRAIPVPGLDVPRIDIPKPK